MKQALLIGIDGASLNLITYWAKTGQLPTFKMLMEKGVYGNLESTIPPLSIPAWNCLSSGKNPGKIGVFSFLSLNRKNLQFQPDFLYIQQKYIWDFLSEQGKNVIVANVPNLHKSYEVNGCLVSGFLYLDKNLLAYPESLKDELDAATEGYEVDVLDVEGVFDSVEQRFKFIDNTINREARRKYLEKIRIIDEKHFKAFKFLLEKKPWSFAFVVFVSPDRVQHRFWDDKNTLLDVYKRLDSMLQMLLSIVSKETTVLIVSDHGFGPRKRVFNINDWLLKMGYLKLKTNPKENFFGKLLKRIGTSKIAKKLANFFPSQIKLFLQKKVNYKKIKFSDVDWQLTKAFAQFSEEKSYGDIFLNITKDDTFDLNQYQKTLNDIVQQLKNLEDQQTKQKISLKVYTKQEIYHGNYVDKAPDLMIILDENVQGFNTTIGHSHIFTSGTGGEHTMNGIFFAIGPNIKKGFEVKGAKIYDIVPTIMHILDVPIPSDVDGKVLTEIFEREGEQKMHRIKYSLKSTQKEKEETHLPSVEDEVKKRLQRLGYI